MTRLLNSELHLHLYGCLTPEHLFELGKDLFSKRSAALEWYRTEYKKHTGADIDWRSYWSGSQGVERIAKDFLATTPMTFFEFQARFNLMIALLPTNEFAPLVLRQVIAGQVAQNIEYGEYRIFVPPGLSPTELAAYYRRLAAAAHALNQKYSGQHISRIILSMSRNPETVKIQYDALKLLQIQDQTVNAMITGVDFCGVEEGFPPEQLANVCSNIRKDNAGHPERSLAILYHVGESFDQMSVFSAMRWIVMADLMGAHRLGHAIAAAVNMATCSRFADGVVFTDPPDQVRAMIDFLSNNPLMNENEPVRGFLLQQYQNRSSDGTPATFVWNQELRQAAAAMQKTILSELRCRGTIIETCPTSNRIIGRITKAADLPVFRLAEENINLLISSDDPGIFATTLGDEELLVTGTGGLTGSQIKTAAKNNELLRSGILAGRPVC